MACSCCGHDPCDCPRVDLECVSSLHFKLPEDHSWNESIYHDGANYGGIHNQLVCYQNQIGKAKALLQKWVDCEGHGDLDTLNLLCEIFGIKES